MSDIPIQKLEDLLLVTVPPNLLDSQVVQLRRDTLRGVRRHRARWVLLDFSRVIICDSYFGRFIHGMATSARLMGAQVVVCGLQDAVVETLVELGFDLPDIHAVLDLDEAMAFSRAAKERDPFEEAGLDEDDTLQLDPGAFDALTDASDAWDAAPWSVDDPLHG
mgnify:CR=1 FL=1